MLLLLQYTLIFASVLLLVALGGCFSEHSGVINIGLEGIMVMGALGGALMMKFLPAGTSAFVVVLLTVLASILLGMIYSLLLAVAAVNFKADQTLVGTAMNLLGTAAATVFVKAMNTAADPDNVSSTIQYLDGRKAFLVNIGGFEFNWCMLLAVIALVIAYVVLYKTRFGLRLCACGEHPQAADSVGINVYRMRYAGVLISGVLGGLGGIVYIIAGVSEWKFENGVAGFGFLALAVMIFGQWKPTRIALAALLFGFGILAAGEKGRPAAALVDSLTEVCMKVMDIILRLSPIGVFCLILPVVAENGPQILGNLGLVLLCAYIGYFLHAVIVYSATVKALGGVSPLAFFKGMFPAMAMAFSSASSVGTLPLNLECTERLGARRDIASFVLPLGATINMDGTAIYMGIVTIFAAEIYGMPLPLDQQISVLLIALLASVGTMGVPGAALIMLSMIFTHVGIPLEAIALVAGIDRVMDMARTTINVLGDATAAIFISRTENDFDPQRGAALQDE